MGKDNKRSLRTKTFWAEKLLEPLEQQGIEQHLTEGVELVRKRKVVDLQIAKGVLSARVQLERGRGFRVRFAMPPITDDIWDRTLEPLAHQAGVLAQLLVAELPSEIEEVLRQSGSSLLAVTADELTINCECRHKETSCAHAAALYYLATERLERDPTAILCFRGRDRDQLVESLREHRRLLRPHQINGTRVSYEHVPYEPAPPLQKTLDRFWSAGEAIKGLQYTIRADELPAALLRRLDPLPVAEGGAYLEIALDELYVRIARRAQALGLGL